MDEFHHVVAGQRMNITLFDFKLRACRHLEDEQAKASPDNALIALLCEGVRLAREHEEAMRRPIPLTPEPKYMSSTAHLTAAQKRAGFDGK